MQFVAMVSCFLTLSLYNPSVISDISHILSLFLLHLSHHSVIISMRQSWSFHLIEHYHPYMYMYHYIFVHIFISHHLKSLNKNTPFCNQCLFVQFETDGALKCHCQMAAFYDCIRYDGVKRACGVITGEWWWWKHRNL